MERLKKIYLLRNKLDGMEYIGQTKQELKRRLWHGYNPDTPIQQAIDRDGLENFDKEILEEDLTQEEADEKEQYYIRTRNTVWPNGYNLQTGGKHFKKHPLTSQRTSQAMMGHSTSIETREKIASKQSKKKVYQYKEGVLVKEYSSLHEASRKTGVDVSNISACCHGRLEKVGESFWSFQKFY